MRKDLWNAHKEALRELRLRHQDEYHQILEKKMKRLACHVCGTVGPPDKPPCEHYDPEDFDLRLNDGSGAGGSMEVMSDDPDMVLVPASLLRRLNDALVGVLHTAHPVTPTSARSGAGGMTITQHCDLPNRPDLVEAAEVTLRALWDELGVLGDLNDGSPS